MTSAVQPDAEPVRTQTARLLASPHFTRSQALSRLLRFIVDETLDGRDQELKEYRLGVDVFGRSADFDPRIDPVVRLQAAKLRSRLAEYYSGEGADDPVVISVPKGGYIPVFALRETASPNAAAPPEVQAQSIAVLPFVSMSSDPENDYFADGLTEELINALAYVPELRVVARTSVFSFKNTAQDVREIGNRLNVRTVLEGSVRKAGNQLRVTAQLIDVATGYHLLSRTYPRELKDVFALQEELAREVVAGILPHLGTRRAPVVRAASNLDAYTLYLKGMYAAASSFAGPRQSIQLFRQALDLDPGYAPAWAGMAGAYTLLAWFAFMNPREAAPLAKAAALKAIELDPESAHGHMALGVIQCADEWKWAEGERSFRRAIALQPSLAPAYAYFAVCCLMPQRRFAESMEAAERAMSLDPFNGILGGITTYVAASAGDYEGALRQFQLSRDANPNHPLVYCPAGLALEGQGKLPEALDLQKQGVSLSGPTAYGLASIGCAQARLGDLDAAKALLPQVAELPNPTYPLAMLYLAVGDMDSAAREFEKGLDEREPHMITTTYDPRFTPYLDDPRLRKLVARMGLKGPSGA